MNDDIAISLNNVSKEYRIYQSNKEVIAHELLGRDSGKLVTALNGFSLEIKKGEKVALIGGGRSGKTSLIKIIAGITAPTSGDVTINGKVTTAITFSAGFDMEMTGRENIYIKGTLLGWSREKTKKEEEGLIEFAGLENIIDFKMKTYSIADIARLGVAMFTATDADIYVLDSPFAVGDKQKRQNCMKRLKTISEDPDKTMVIVNSFLPFGYQLCDRGIVMDDGKVLFDGKPRDAVKLFKENAAASEDIEEEQNDMNKRDRTRSEAYVMDEQSVDGVE